MYRVKILFQTLSPSFDVQIKYIQQGITIDAGVYEEPVKYLKNALKEKEQNSWRRIDLPLKW